MTIFRSSWIALGLLALAVGYADEEDESPDKSCPRGLRLQHGDVVTCVLFSPDGKTVATGTEDGRLRLWDRATGKRLLSFSEGRETITALAFSPDGKCLASTSDEKSVRLWTPPNEDEARSLESDTVLNGVAFSPDGKFITAVGEDGTLRVWETDTGKERPKPDTLPEHAVRAVFSPDGKALAFAGTDKAVHLWDLASGKPLAVCQGHTAEVCALAFSPDGKMLVSGAGDATLRFWSAASGLELLRLVQRDREDVSAVAFSGDGTLVASGSSEGRIQLWDLATGQSLLSFPGHSEERVCALAFPPDGKTLLSGGGDGKAVIWTLPDSLLPKPMTPAEATPEALASLWEALADSDAAKAYRATWTLASVPEKAAPFLKERLQPLVVDSARIHQLVVDLDNDAFRTRDAAFHTLEELGPLAERELRKAAKETDSAEVRERAGQLLDALASPIPASTEVRRRLRALAALERMGTAEAREVLAALAAGLPEIRETQAAKAILARMGAHP